MCVANESMFFCKSCGTPLEDGTERCFICGAVQEVKAESVAEPTAVVDAPAEEPVAEAPVADAPAVETPVAFETPDFSDPEPKKKRSRKKIIIPIVAVVSAAAVLLCALNWDWIMKFLLDKFGKDEDLRDKVIVEQTDEVVDGLSDQYGTTIENIKGVVLRDKNITTKVELVVSDDAEELVEEYEDLIVDFLGDDFYDIADMVKLLNGSYVTMGIGGVEEELGGMIAAGINGDEVLSAGGVIDLVEETLIASIPILSDYKLDLSEYFADVLDDMDISGEEAVDAALVVLEAMPSKETVNKLMKKYISLALAEFDDVSKDKDTLTIGGIKEKVTVLETELTASDLLNAGASVLEEMQKDVTIEAIIIDMGEALNEAGLMAADPDDLYEEFQDELDYMIEDLEDQADDIYDDVDILWTQYLNSAYEIVGMELEVDGDEILYYATATKGKKFATEVEIARKKVITGEGTNEKGIVNGIYEIDGDALSSVFYFYGLDDMTIDIKVSNFDKNAWKKGEIKGSFELVLDDELLYELADEYDVPSYIVSAATSLFDLGIKLDINTVGDSDSLQLSVTDGGAVLVGVKMTTTIADGDLKVPEASEEALELYEWVSTVSTDDLLYALGDAGVPLDWLMSIFY